MTHLLSCGCAAATHTHLTFNTLSGIEIHFRIKDRARPSNLFILNLMTVSNIKLFLNAIHNKNQISNLTQWLIIGSWVARQHQSIDIEWRTSIESHLLFFPFFKLIS